jgi:hypothetical protein
MNSSFKKRITSSPKAGGWAGPTKEKKSPGTTWLKQFNYLSFSWLSINTKWSSDSKPFLYLQGLELNLFPSIWDRGLTKSLKIGPSDSAIRSGIRFGTIPRISLTHYRTRGEPYHKHREINHEVVVGGYIYLLYLGVGGTLQLSVQGPFSSQKMGVRSFRFPLKYG